MWKNLACLLRGSPIAPRIAAAASKKSRIKLETARRKVMKSVEPTWQPHTEHGDLTTRSNLPETVFAFPKQRKEPLTDAQHVRNAVARFDQVTDVSDEDRALAFANIEKAAQHYNVNLSETDWHQLGVHPQERKRA
jgi:hypothetical protein